MKKTPLIVAAVLGVLVVLIGIITVAGRDNSGSTMNSTDSMQSMESNSQMNSSEATQQPAAEAVATDKVEITDYMYSPAVIKVKVGTTVTWTNNDTVRHNVAGDNNDLPEGELIGRGESYSYTFKKAGTYDYFCTPHPYMKGTVIVE